MSTTRPKAEKFYVYEFYAIGSGTFPYDMLRYDACTPADESGARSMGDFEYRRILMRRYAPVRTWATPRRWESFGWKVEEVR